ncbi:DUF1178 family protein [Roseomonas elaeocarpi]|uniref:DUF1178 family protein n=1 Tax=Roseomonas elaeocarpi TaxID=907779 RepID=A0ABV6JUT3_9PROT
MIHYQLRCDAGHEFDGWFHSSTGFEKMAAAALVECPVCGTTEVSRALMAPALAKGRAEPAATPEPAPESESRQQIAAGPMPAQMLALLQRLRAEVEQNCDHVGADFAEEARRMHAGESERRGIYGEATEAEAEALLDDGIEIARIPWVPRSDG